ncbi:DUF1080 domain-containing protein [Tautonia sp. JC769]|uniref:3-keto-disaccharide hydrolase n=1 Tax=Tautonia sp. JC769 TaxID=3232135 RepID=UPI00345A4450
MRSLRVIPLVAAVLLIAQAPRASACPDEQGTDDGWITVFGEGTGLDAFRAPFGDWQIVGSAAINEDDPKHLRAEPGSGVLINDPPGRTRNLETVREFGDVEIEIEYMMAEDSNAGVKFQGLYEIQMYDSYGKEIDARGNGGVYPRAELLPRYRHIDEGFPPKVNASRPAGEWQVLRATFRAPRFDDSGKKTAHALLERAELNGQVIHEQLEIPYPTGHAWRTKAEKPLGPILLQGDHGPVAFRAVRIRPLAP